MATVVFAIGAAVAAVLLCLLLLTLMLRPLRIWPTPGPAACRATSSGPCSVRSTCFASRRRDAIVASTSACRHGSACRPRVALGFARALHLFVSRPGPGQQLWSAGRIGDGRDLPLEPQSAERHADRRLRLSRGRRRWRFDLCAVRGHDRRLCDDGAGRGAVARGGLRRAVPALPQRGARFFNWRLAAASVWRVNGGPGRRPQS